MVHSQLLAAITLIDIVSKPSCYLSLPQRLELRTSRHAVKSLENVHPRIYIDPCILLGLQMDRSSCCMNIVAESCEPCHQLCWGGDKPLSCEHWRL